MDKKNKIWLLSSIPASKFREGVNRKESNRTRKSPVHRGGAVEVGSNLVHCDASYVTEIRVGKLQDLVNPKHSVQVVKKVTGTATRDHKKVGLEAKRWFVMRW